jgi:hypothetical protein
MNDHYSMDESMFGDSLSTPLPKVDAASTISVAVVT